MAVEAAKTNGSIGIKLEQYVRRILDLSRKNKAIYFAICTNGSSWKIKTKGFKLSQDALYKLMNQERVTLLRFSTARNEMRGGCIRLDESDWKDAERALRKLYSRNREFVKDYGVNICYVIYGFLVWKESPASGKEVWIKSPLFVAEANLERRIDRRRGQVVYQASLATPFRVNESLAEILRLQYELDLTEGLAEEGEDAAIELEDVDGVESALKRIEDVALEMGWRLEREVWIAGLYFGTVGIYHDAKRLLESGKLGGSPIIRAICGEEREPPIPHPKPPNEHEIDFLETPLPADKSQCEVLWYAEKGCNLVVHGPPGTGKSQTIANLIARAIKLGRKVLFVAERREAIDVVYDRLRELGLTLPVLRVFTITRKERDRVIEDLLNTMRYIIENGSQPSSNADNFPKHEYAYEWEYFELLTGAANLYKSIGEVVLKERELEKLGLIDLASKYHGREIWKEYEGIDELILQTYWDKVVQLLKLPLLPRRNELRAIPLMVSFLEEVEKRFGDLSHREITALFKLTRGLYENLRSLEGVQALEFYLKTDEQGRQKLHKIVHELASSISRLKEVRRKLENIPDDEALSEAEEALLRYGSWLKRVFSGDYKALRAGLERELGISMKLPHKGALEHLTQLRYQRYRLLEEETRERKNIRGLAQQIKEGGYAPLILPLNEERMNRILHTVDNILKLRESPQTSEGVKFLERDFSLFKKFADQASAEELDSMASLLDRIPESGGIRILLNVLHKIREAVEGIASVGLDTVINLVKQIEKLPSLRKLISDVPVGVSFQQFKTLIEYLKLREKCESILESCGVRGDYRLVRNCRDRIREFYIEREKQIAREWLSRWLRVESVSYHAHMLLHTRKRERRRSPGALLRFYEKLIKEHRKKKRKVSLRRLFNEYLPQILEVKPILMMSPVAVSALLPRDFLEPLFDLVVFDEASQMKVEMALPSIARGKQLITIGDEHQMPPSRYFERLAFFAEEEEEEEELPESLLQACLEAEGFFKQLWLKWYYRGSHESLIAFSNRHFYKDKLIVLPSPNPNDSRVEFVYVNCPSHPNGGCYIEGRGINPCEARVVVRKLLEELSKLDNNNFTVGIVAMNDRQQDVIEDLIERVCQESDLKRVKELLGMPSGTLDMFSEQGERRRPLEITEELIDRLAAMLNADRIWVRNLESVQGKEADIVILSMTYGKGKDGKLRQQFGPINRKGGERRINVLISRARERMIVVSSMRYTDLRVERETPEGVKILRDFLRYAEEGGRLVEEREGGEFESPFEESVYYCLLDALSDLGVEIVPQVGVGKYRIDLGIRKDGRYLLGVECDGALYHKHRAARERDRIRDECLRRMGWDIYHIWSTAWFDRSLRAQIFRGDKGAGLGKATRSLCNLRSAPYSDLIQSLSWSEVGVSKVSDRRIS